MATETGRRARSLPARQHPAEGRPAGRQPAQAALAFTLNGRFFALLAETERRRPFARQLEGLNAG